MNTRAESGGARITPRLWIRATLSFGVLSLLLLLLPWNEVLRAVRSISPRVWGAVLCGFLGGHFVGVFKWRLLVNSITGSLGVIDAWRCYAAGLFANLCLPSIVGGDVLRAILAARTTGHAHAAVLGGLADRTLDMTGLGLVIAAGGIAAGDLYSGWETPLAVFFALIGACASLACLPFLLRVPLSRWPTRFRRPLGRSLVALRRLRRRPGAASAALLASVAIQSTFVLLNAWIGHSIGITVPLSVWFVVWPLAKVAGLLPISLGGLGVRDGTLAALLLPFGVPAAQGLVVSLVWQSVLIAGGLVGGLLWKLLRRDVDKDDRTEKDS